MKLDLRDAQLCLHRALETQGENFVYRVAPTQQCINVPATDDLGPYFAALAADHPARKTGCLVGTAMRLSNVVPPEEWAGLVVGNVIVFDQWLTAEALEYFRLAQYRQDSGDTWGQSVAVADAWVRGYHYARLNRDGG